MTTPAQVQSIIRTLEVEEHIQASGPTIIREHPSRDGALCAVFDGVVRDVSTQYKGRPVLRYIGSDNSEDRHVSVLEQGPDAVNTTYYEANPAFCWAHQYGIPIIGNTIALDLQKNRTVFDVEFLLEEWDLPNTANLARLVYRLAKLSGDPERAYLRGMPASSVGFIPEEKEDYETSTPAPWYMSPTRFLKWELLELSSVPIPSNRNALKKGLAAGDISENEIDFLGLGRFMSGDEPLIVHFPKARIAADVTTRDATSRIAKLPLVGQRAADKAGVKMTKDEARELADILRTCGTIEQAVKFLEIWRALTPEQRAGAVLSKRNANRLLDAVDQIGSASDAITTVLDEAGYGDSGGDSTTQTNANDDDDEVVEFDDATLRELDAVNVAAQNLRGMISGTTSDDDDASRAGADGDALTQGLTEVSNLAATILNFAK